MIPFDKIYSWLFKSFNISGETDLIKRLIDDGYGQIMIVKRSWIFALLMMWIPLVILSLSGVSIWIAYDSIEIASIKYTLIIGNILMSLILLVSSTTYVSHFRKIHGAPQAVSDVTALTDELAQGDQYFRSFFNWSITNQLILILIVIIELALILFLGKNIGSHFWILATDTLVIFVEIFFLRHFRKRMMDLEMDYNVVVPGKIFFVNQSGILSTIQTIESDKIKTVQSSFPSKIASFFNYGNINILTEGDSQAMMGTMSMYYVTDPDGVVSNILSLLDKNTREEGTPSRPEVGVPPAPTAQTPPSPAPNGSGRHSLDTREKIRTVLR